MMIVVAHLKLSGVFRLVSGWTLTDAHSPRDTIAILMETIKSSADRGVRANSEDLLSRENGGCPCCCF